MNAMLSFLDQLREFLATGGPVLWVILGVTFWMWSLILERLSYLWLTYPGTRRKLLQVWQSLATDQLHRQPAWQKKWLADKLRARLVSSAGLGLQKHTDFIIALVAICPLLGLFGTVLGMLEVFDIMSHLGGHNVRSTAAGVSKATITTMAGMVAALPGVVAGTYLKRRIQHERLLLTDLMTLDTSGRPLQ